MTQNFLTGTAVIVILGGKVLLSRRLAGASDAAGKWAVPGGCLESTDANIIAGARRELKEETGLDLPANATVYPAVEEGNRPDGTPYATVFVVAEINADAASKLCNPEPHKHSDWQWLTPSDLPPGAVLWSCDVINAVLGVGQPSTVEYWKWRAEVERQERLRVVAQNLTLVKLVSNLRDMLPPV